MNLYNIYIKSFYGSNLWNINSRECHRLYSTWNIAVRECFQLSRLTHRYFIEAISQFFHTFVDICIRLVTFDNSLIEAAKAAISLLAKITRKDCRTVHGQNMKFIAKRCDLTSIDGMTSPQVKSTLKYLPIPIDEEWRLDIISEMLSFKAECLYDEDFNKEEINSMLEMLCYITQKPFTNLTTVSAYLVIQICTTLCVCPINNNNNNP